MRTFNLKECAQFLKIGESTAQALAAAGRIPGAKVGVAWVFLEDDIVEFLRNRVREETERRRERAKTVSAELSPIEVPRRTGRPRRRPPVLESDPRE